MKIPHRLGGKTTIATRDFKFFLAQRLAARRSGLDRPDHHDHLAAFHFGHVLDLADTFDIGGNPLQKGAAKLQMRHLPAAKPERHLHLVAFFQKLEDIAHLDVVIMGIRVGAELDFLDLDRLLLFPRLGFPLLHLVFVFAKIHDLGDRRVGVRRNFHQIEPDFLGKLAAALGRDNAQIFAFGANQAKLIRGDALIRAGSGVALRWRVVWSACYLT